ncbi:MAG TPA: N-acetylmuramoyl-L-alanine amidase [Ferruginibacter sp.]|jgi:N-acetylmuramoyl-L-alanine amidase|nr:N-acetylmuramoyl-L-alanine amidase [Ferruginibacter sp.]
MLKKKLFVPALLIAGLISLQTVAQTPKKIRTIIIDAGHGGKDGGAHGGYEGGLNSWEKNITLAISNKLVAELQKELPYVKVVPTRTDDIYQSPPEKANFANQNKGDLFICIHADAVVLQTGRRQIGTKSITRQDVLYVGKGKKRKKKYGKKYNEVVPVYDYYKIGSPRTGTSIWVFDPRKTTDKISAIEKNQLSDEDIQIDSTADSTFANTGDSRENRMLAQIYAKRYQEKSIELADLINDEIATTDRPALGVYQRKKGIWVLQATNMPAVLIETGFITNYNDERYLNSDAGQQEIAACIARAIVKYKEQVENSKSTPAPSASVTPESTTVSDSTKVQ